jgi:hypothetical protein
VNTSTPLSEPPCPVIDDRQILVRPCARQRVKLSSTDSAAYFPITTVRPGSASCAATDYLSQLKTQIDELDSQVEAQLRGVGPSSNSGTTNYINPVNDLTLLAGPGGFEAGVAISTALKNAGSSVYDQLQWLDNILKEMSQEITTTISTLKGTESLNNEAVDTLVTDFQNTINDMSTPAGSGSSNPNPNTTTSS